MSHTFSPPIHILAPTSLPISKFPTNQHPTPTGLLYQFTHAPRFLPVSCMNWRDEVFVCDRRGNVFRVDLSKGESTLIIRFGNAISHIATNPLQPGELMLASLQTNKLSLYNTNVQNAATLLSTMPRVHDKKIHYFEFHPRSRICVSISDDCVAIWDTLKLQTKKVLTCPKTNTAQPQRFQHACFHNDELLTCINDCIYIWDLQTYALRDTLEMPPNSASRHLDFVTFAVSPDGAYLLSGGLTHNYVAVWNYQERALHRVIALPYGSNGVRKFLISPDSERCILLTKEGKIICMRLNDFFILFEVHAVTSYYLNVAVSADWKLMEAHTDEGLIQVYDLPTLQQHQQKLRQIQTYAAILEQDPTLSDSQKYLSSVDVAKVGSFDSKKIAAPPRPSVQTNNFVAEGMEDTNKENAHRSQHAYNVRDPTSYERNPPAPQFEFASPQPSKNLAQSKRSAFRKSVPRKIRTTKWTERNAQVTMASFKAADRDVPPKQVQLPRSNAKEMALNFEKLRRLLLTHGEYPEKYRTLVWRFVLSLPENNDVFSNLLMKGPHVSTHDLHKRFPITDGRLFRRLCKVLSALAHYSPVFACGDSVPELAFPFLKVYGSDFVSIFETVITFYRNWGREWLDVVPNAPKNVLDMVEHILEENDPGLLDHFKQCHVNAEEYAWTPLKALFSHNFSKVQWCRLMDHVLTMPPTFLYYFTVAYLTYFRQTILSMESEEDFAFFFEHESPCDINKIIQKAYDLLQRTELRFPTYEQFEKLPASFYPIMSKFPKQEVRPQLNSRERILREEKKLLQRKQRFVEEEKARLQTRDESISHMRLNESLQESDERLKQEMREREEELVKRRTDLINQRLRQKERADLVESDKAQFSVMDNEVQRLRASQIEMQRQIDRANAEIAHLKYERMLAELQKEKMEIQDALSRQGQENSLLRESLEQKEREIENLRSNRIKDMDNEDEQVRAAPPQSVRATPNQEQREQPTPSSSSLERSVQEEIRVDTLNTEQLALQKNPLPTHRRPSDPVGKQLESGVLSPPPKPLGAAPVPVEQSKRTPRRDTIDTTRAAASKNRPSSSRTTQPATKNKKVVIPKPARSATPSSLSEDTPISPPVSNRKRVPIRSTQSSATKYSQQTPATTPQSSAQKQKGQLSEEQNRYIREKFRDFIHSRTTIEGESPGKVVSSSGTEYPWMEELSDSISISDSYSLGDVSKDEDSILQTLEEKRRPVDFNELSYMHDEDTTEDLSFIDDDDDMITTLPSTTLGDFTVPSGLKTESSLNSTAPRRPTVNLTQTSGTSASNLPSTSTTTTPSSALRTTPTSSSTTTPAYSKRDPLDNTSSNITTSGTSGTTTPSGAEHPSNWVSSSSSGTTSATMSLTSTPESKSTTRRKRLVYSSPSISFTSNPRTSDYMDSGSSDSDDSAVPLNYHAPGNTKRINITSDTERGGDSLAESTATTDILQTSTSS